MGEKSERSPHDESTDRDRKERSSDDSSEQPSSEETSEETVTEGRESDDDVGLAARDIDVNGTNTERDTNETDQPEDSEDTEDVEEEVDAEETSTDGGSTASVGVGSEIDSGTETGGSDDVDEELFEAPDEDEEMPLADHIDEMMRRLGVVFAFGGVAMLITYPWAGDTINYLWGTHIPQPNVNAPRIYGPLEFILTKLKVAGLAGLLVGLPVFVYQTYRFMKPGLYRNERKYYLASVPTSLVLGIVGVLFAHFIILPFIFSYFTVYTEDAAAVAFGLRETFAMMLALMGYMAVIFQIPLFIMLAIMMGLVTRKWLEDKRLIFWGLFVGVAFTFTAVDPTGMAPIIIALTMIALFEITLALLRWTGN
ncbi:twin-arginine translocase subunit TatC [Natronocalculus amylovorans]|uniref:Sec-independent protein translocase protein TatC n=1 Tax=Natronocalculus amylovorans TaxID=2917812 RepID=A0AAE3FUM2_9EURY|nr:twin-arginine translocase subunit TatC [Natronocalculus amylovorans]MCL9815882.1 twin-arginine translocase subunit TatC [Natronocalculus amylovorans]NUE01606.1 preprotein translocase subunit TatC [Halorubraceae archaeon YAN]